MQELAWVASARAVSGALTQVLQTYSAVRTFRQAELNSLRDKIDVANRLAHAEAYGEIVRANIEQIAMTQRLIDSRGLTGPALDEAYRQLRTLGDLLTDNIRRYAQTNR